MLQFLGIGSCFNPLAGNTAAFYKDEKKKNLIFFDMGGNIYERVMRENLLQEELNKVVIVITHLHDDHVGSLASLIEYCDIVLNLIPTIIYPNLEEIEKTLLSMGVRKGEYELLLPRECKMFPIREYQQKHNDVIDAYGYLFELEGKKIYYSGDTNLIQMEIIGMLLDGEIEYIYHEVTRYHNHAHTHLNQLEERIPVSFRKKVTCMHFDDEELKKDVKKAGFLIPKIYKRVDC